MPRGVVNVPNTVSRTFYRIPRNCNEADILAVDFKRRKSDRYPYMSSNVSPMAVLQAAKYLAAQQLLISEGIKYDDRWSPDIPHELDFFVGQQRNSDFLNAGI